MKMLTIAATLAAVLVSAGTAMAVPISGVPAPSAQPGQHPGQNQGNQYQSNQNIRAARRHIARATGRLQSDAWDYGGHKLAAMGDLQSADQLLTQALDWIHSHRGQGGGTGEPGSQGGVLPMGGVMQNSGTPTQMGTYRPGGNGGPVGQGGSNENITFVRQHIAAAISALNSDDSDYGGYKHQAIGKLSAADSEMQAAIAFVQKPGVVNGSKNPHLSDANLAYVKEHVETAIDRLSQDSHDYGGHRTDAVNDLRQADSYINSALSYDNSHERYNSSAAGTVGATNVGASNFAAGAPNGKPYGTAGGAGINRTPTIQQGQSNDSLAYASQHLELAIDGLQRDAHDYNGFREKALDSLQAARSQLQQALAYRNAHGQS